MCDKTQASMETINEFLKDNSYSDLQEEMLSVNADDVNHINKMFISLHPERPRLSILPQMKENQLWTVQSSYLDFEGNMQHAKHKLIVMIVSGPDYLDSDTSFVRVCPISPFVEMSSEADCICDDSSIIGFPFVVETWNEQPVLTEILDKYVGDYNVLRNDKEDNPTSLQKEFREIEISNARFLNHSITAYINEKERDNIFAFSVDLHYSEVAKTVHMPILNVKNPKLISLSDHEEYAQAARLNNFFTENDSININDSNLPFSIEVRKRSGVYILTIIPKVEIVLTKDGQEIKGMSNSERLVYSDLPKGLYKIQSPLINEVLTIRLK